jgi:hypothetical protein
MTARILEILEGLLKARDVYGYKPFHDTKDGFEGYIIIPGISFNLHIKLDDIGTITGFLDDLAGA